jgi:hypothetical protein
LAGFAFGLVAAGIWLYALTPNRRAGSPPAFRSLAHNDGLIPLAGMPGNRSIKTVGD